MSKKGPRSDAFLALTASLSEEVIERYIDIACEVRDKELARRREAERRKAAERRARMALLKSLGLLPPGWGKKKSKKAKKGKVSGAAGEARGREGAAKSEAAPRSPGSAREEPALLAPKANPGQGKKPKPITRADILKLAIADELGYLETVRQDGWGGLTSAQSGRVGGTMTRRMKRLKKGLPPV